MEPKDKAKELFSKFYNINKDGIYDMTQFQAKQCALIAIEEILNFMEEDDRKNDVCGNINSPEYRYYEQVKKEIEEL